MNTSNVTAAKPRSTGVVFVGASGATLPTDAKTALSSSAFTSLGYVSEDGVAHNNSRSSEVVRDMGGKPVLTVQTEVEDTFKFKLIEGLNVEVLKAIYGASNVTGATLAAGIKVTEKGDEPVSCVWVIDMIGRDGTYMRYVIPNGKISEIDEINYKRDEAVGYDITVNADADATGATHYAYFDAATT